MRALIPIAVQGLAAAWPLIAASADPLPLDQVTIRLFEQADGALLPVTRRIYSTHFDATRTRSLGLEILASHGPPEASLDIPVACNLRAAEASDAAMELSMILAFGAGQTQTAGVGLFRRATDLESWLPGEYAIECRIDGQVVAMSRIEIALNPPDVADTDIRVAALQLFPVERTLPAKDDRRYASTLVAAETRHIGVELEFTHAPLGQAMKIPVECYYFWPDGQTSPPVLLSYEPQATWSGGYSAGAIGWDQAGRWPAGTYAITCMIHGRPVIVDRFDLY